METLKTPIVLKIISLFVIVIYPIMYLFPINKVEQYYLFKLDITAVLISSIFILILLSIFIFLGIKLWKGKNYSRVIVVILSLLYPFLVFPSSQFSYKILTYFILVAVPFYLIAIILLFSKKIKFFFNNYSKMVTWKVIFLVLIIVLPILTFFPIYNGRVICGTFAGCWHSKVNLIEYIQYINR